MALTQTSQDARLHSTGSGASERAWCGSCWKACGGPEPSHYSSGGTRKTTLTPGQPARLSLFHRVQAPVTPCWKAPGSVLPSLLPRLHARPNSAHRMKLVMALHTPHPPAHDFLAGVGSL